MHSTAISSRPLNNHSASSPAFKAVGNCPRRRVPRPVKQLSYELANHSKSYLEAGQYANGYDFLYSLLNASTSISVPAKPYIGLLPPPAQLALASTLIVYPATTTMTNSVDKRRGSDAALKYLRCVHNTIEGPAYRTIRKAFDFPEERTRRRPPGHRSRPGSPSPGPLGDVEHISGIAAGMQSIWYRAQDFWHIVGWAFNCSVRHKKRWARWKLWLEIMLDFLEADWEVCAKEGRREVVDQEDFLRESLIWRYISSDDPTNRNNRRKIVRAILAMATSQSRKEFPEVWIREPAEPRKEDDREKKPIAKVDFEAGELGDYGSEDEEMIMQTAGEQSNRQRQSRRASSSSQSSEDDAIIVGHEDAINRLGGIDAINLRQRIIALLAQVADALPSAFTPLDDFLDNLTEEFIRLPTLIFSILISTSQMPGPFQLALNANLALPLVSRQLPNYILTDPTQIDFEERWLPLRASTQSFAANAKLSLILEQLLMFMMTENLLSLSGALRQAIESGIEARGKVYGTGKGKRGNAKEEDQGKVLMEASSERLLGLLEVLEIQAGRTPQPRKEISKSLPPLSSFGSSFSSAPESDTERDD